MSFLEWLVQLEFSSWMGFVMLLCFIFVFVFKEVSYVWLSRYLFLDIYVLLFL
jgi:hypothetical protein